MKLNAPARIFILGNIAGGKSKMARRLGRYLQLPIIHVDALEFNPNLSKKPMPIVRRELQSALTQSQWILDGHGPLDLLPEILKMSDAIIYLNLPYETHWFWLLKRQLFIIFSPRPEMPSGAREWNWSHIQKLFQTLKKQDLLMKPELQRILRRSENAAKLVHVQTVEQWQDLYKHPNLYFQQRKG